MSVQTMASLSPIDRRQLIQLCAGSLALTALNCGRGKDRAYSRGSTLTIGYGFGRDVLTPWADEEIAQLMFLPLVAEDKNGEPVPRLARSWEHSPDYRTWTYHLRTDVRWHDGAPVTAQDVKFSVQLLLRQGFITNGLIDSVTVPEDATIRFHSRQPRGREISGLLTYPRHVLERLDPTGFHEWDFWARPVGNGPYRFVRYIPETMMELEANPDYFRGKPKIERVVLKFVGRDVTELLSGNVDLIPYANPAHIPLVRADPRYRVSYQLVTSLVHAIYWRNDHPLFTDVRVRQALTLAIHRRELLQLLGFAPETPLVDGVFTKRQAGHGQFPAALPHDPPRARALLEAAGWRDHDGDGVREREGKEFRFTALVTTREGVVEMAQYVQDQLRRVGVRMELQPLDQGNVREKLKSGDFEAAFAFLRQLPSWLEQDLAEARYKNSAAASVLGRLSITPDPDELDDLYRQLTDILRADIPVTILLPFLDTFFAHRRIQGIPKNLSLADPIEHVEDLWLEDESQQ